MEPEAKSCKLQNFYDAQSCALSIICILIGAVVCFYGYRFFKFMLFLAGFLVAFVFTYLLCSAHLTNELSGNALKYKEQVFLGISIGVGLLAGLFTMCLYYVGLFLLEYMADHNWLPNLILTTFAVALGILIICIQKVVIIISTSFLGAFLLVNGLDYYLENSKVLNYSLNILHAFTRTRSHFTMMGTQMQDFGDEQPIVTEYE
ncbi:Transmembrane protein 198 [Acropora cervicornis]|uniref:Transmembrane protein 198 n=1 Tax=Acropora cervicornis TaxID=6130 RepID=A0AAD9Q234_ACRCE|nr:Transmembrane protein 198 [Acropora cervicornis]